MSQISTSYGGKIYKRASCSKQSAMQLKVALSPGKKGLKKEDVELTNLEVKGARNCTFISPYILVEGR